LGIQHQICKFQWVKRKRNDGEYLRRLGKVEIHGENLRFGWFWVGGLREGVGGLREGERAAAFDVGR
jgi:hypothetical protein